MSRSARLFDLLHALRRHRRPVKGETLSGEIGVSLRTLYRDIGSLRAQGAEITGEPGVGYVLKPGFLLPSLMFSPEEIEALALGTRWVADHADGSLADSARSALARIAAVLPRGLRKELEHSTLLIAPAAKLPRGPVAVEVLRQAIRQEQKLRITYRDGAGASSRRVVWPFALAFFERSRILMCWCERRGDFRNFRADRIARAEPTGARYPRSRKALLAAWNATLPEGSDLRSLAT